MKILLSTSNQDKLKELKKILGEDFEILLKSDFNLDNFDIIEDGKTLEENAYKKAKALYDKTKLNVLADDTGLFVDVLEGRPGVFSARYAGEDGNYEANNQKLLKEMKNYKNISERKAHFKTVLCFISENEEVHYIEGRLDGFIGFEKRGKNGFGYDPLFVLENDKTLAEITNEEKNKISHRSRALSNFKKLLKEMK